jgi:hypothetical protein
MGKWMHVRVNEKDVDVSVKPGESCGPHRLPSNRQSDNKVGSQRRPQLNQKIHKIVNVAGTPTSVSHLIVASKATVHPDSLGRRPWVVPLNVNPIKTESSHASNRADERRPAACR